MSAWLGVIADDVTGACDVAGGVAAAGVPTSVWLGVPDTPADGEECLVVGLKIRTAPVEDAVAQASAAAAWLREQGAHTLYQKYCSTFDSTDTGNIGPVAEALLEAGGAALSVGTPATPQVGRTQYLGHLFVGDRLLSDSPMRDHPLTPMRDSDLVAVLGRQTEGGVALASLAAVHAGAERLAAVISEASESGARHVLVDAVDDRDLDVLAAALEHLAEPVVVGGGAGVAVALARRHAGGAEAAVREEVPPGRRLVLSGSGSARTREQVAAFPGPVLALDPLTVAAEGTAGLESALAAALGDGDGPVLVSATAEPEGVRRTQELLGRQESAALIEDTLGRIALLAVREHGVRRILVAGGETSGAVVASLGLRRLAVAGLGAPGVPWTTGAASAVPGAPEVALLLKSGNFGGEELFTTAWGSAP